MGHSRILKHISLLLILLLPGAVFVYIGVNSDHHFQELEHYGPKKVKKWVRNGDTLIDTVYHKVPDFQFRDEEGDQRRLKAIDARAIFVEFFQKKSILKRMSVELGGFSSIHFLSIVTDTSISGRELRQYTDHIRVDSTQWTFARAPMERIEQFAVEGCFKGAASSDTIRKLIHEHPVMVLLDDQYHVRGVYEGPHANEIDRAIDEIRLLMKEMDREKRAQ